MLAPICSHIGVDENVSLSVDLSFKISQMPAEL